MARTVTSTATYSRFALLTTQVRALLRDTAGASDDALRKVTSGLQPPHYIEHITVSGLFANSKIGAQLELSIDWREHSLKVQAGGANVSVPGSWTNGVAPSLIEAIQTFNTAVDDAGLSVEWTVRFGAQFDRVATRSKLGFTQAPIREWEREPDRLSLGFGVLSEAELVISLAI